MDEDRNIRPRKSKTTNGENLNGEYKVENNSIKTMPCEEAQDSTYVTPRKRGRPRKNDEERLKESGQGESPSSNSGTKGRFRNATDVSDFSTPVSTKSTPNREDSGSSSPDLTPLIQSPGNVNTINERTPRKRTRQTRSTPSALLKDQQEIKFEGQLSADVKVQSTGGNIEYETECPLDKVRKMNLQDNRSQSNDPSGYMEVENQNPSKTDEVCNSLNQNLENGTIEVEVVTEDSNTHQSLSENKEYPAAVGTDSAIYLSQEDLDNQSQKNSDTNREATSPTLDFSGKFPTKQDGKSIAEKQDSLPDIPLSHEVLLDSDKENTQNEVTTKTSKSEDGTVATKQSSEHVDVNGIRTPEGNYDSTQLQAAKWLTSESQGNRSGNIRTESPPNSQAQQVESGSETDFSNDSSSSIEEKKKTIPSFSAAFSTFAPTSHQKMNVHDPQVSNHLNSQETSSSSMSATPANSQTASEILYQNMGYNQTNSKNSYWHQDAYNEYPKDYREMGERGNANQQYYRQFPSMYSSPNVNRSGYSNMHHSASSNISAEHSHQNYSQQDKHMASNGMMRNYRDSDPRNSAPEYGGSYIYTDTDVGQGLPHTMPFGDLEQQEAFFRHHGIPPGTELYEQMVKEFYQSKNLSVPSFNNVYNNSINSANHSSLHNAEIVDTIDDNTIVHLASPNYSRAFPGYTNGESKSLPKKSPGKKRKSKSSKTALPNKYSTAYMQSVMASAASNGCKSSEEMIALQGIQKDGFFLILSPEVNPTDVKDIGHRGLIAKYIDYLIVENEQITEMSKSVSMPVDDCVVDDPYLMDIIRVKVPFPTPRYYHWLHAYYPTIPIDWKSLHSQMQHYQHPLNDEDQTYVDTRSTPVLLGESFYFFQRERDRLLAPHVRA